MHPNICNHNEALPEMLHFSNRLSSNSAFKVSLEILNHICCSTTLVTIMLYCDMAKRIEFFDMLKNLSYCEMKNPRISTIIIYDMEVILSKGVFVSTTGQKSGKLDTIESSARPFRICESGFSLEAFSGQAILPSL